MSHLRALLCLAIIPAAPARNTAHPIPICGPSPRSSNPPSPNIFSEQQERWLGDAEASALNYFSRKH